MGLVREWREFSPSFDFPDQSKPPCKVRPCDVTYLAELGNLAQSFHVRSSLHLIQPLHMHSGIDAGTQYRHRPCPG